MSPDKRWMLHGTKEYSRTPVPRWRLITLSSLESCSSNDWMMATESFCRNLQFPCCRYLFYLFVVAVLSAPWSRERVVRVSTQLGQQQVSITLDTPRAASQTGLPQLCSEGVPSFHSGHILWQSHRKHRLLLIKNLVRCYGRCSVVLRPLPRNEYCFRAVH
jgi:hypothetical protein